MESVDQKVERYLSGNMSSVECRTLLAMIRAFPSMLDSMSDDHRKHMEQLINE